MKNLARILLFLALLVFSVSAEGLEETESWCRLYFTRPERSGHRFTPGNPERGIISLIRSSRVSIRGAFYDLSAEPVIRELVSSLKRGVKVKLVIDDRQFSSRAVERLQESGAIVRHDGRSALMHNKFMVVDGKVLWTGSYNLTDNGSVRNNNNGLEIRQQEIIDIYEDEFQEMFDRNIYGAGGIPLFQAKNVLFTGKGARVEILFAPEDSVGDRLCSLIRGARSRVSFMAFSFTSERLSEAMLERAWEGVDIHGVMEKRGSGSRYSEYVRFIVESSRLRKTRADLKQLTLAINRALSGKSSESWGEIKEMAAEIRPAGRKRRSRLSRYLREIEKLARRLESAEDPGSKGGRVLQNQVKEFLPGGKRYFRPGRIRVVRDKNPGVMHHKVIVIDGRILVTGSYNFSRSADTRNDENTIIIQDPSLACRYIQEFNRLVPGSHRVFCGK